MSKYTVLSNYIGGERVYQVVRVMENRAGKHAGEIEFGAAFESKCEAQAEADRLNRQEGQYAE